MSRLLDRIRKRRQERDILVSTSFLALCLALPLLPAPGRILVQRLDVSSLPVITVFLTILDDADKGILGIAGEEVEVRIDGAAQTVSSLRSALEGGEYLAVVLAFDRSGSMRKALEETKQAALNFLKRMSADDRVAVVSFDDTVRVDSDLSVDRDVIENAIKGIDLGRDTVLYEAIRKGLEILEKDVTPRKALIMLSDGKDTRSKLSRSEVLSLARDKAVPLFTIGLGSGIDEVCLTELSSGTGGTFLRAAGPQDLLRLYQIIAEQLRNQYILTFSSSFGRDEVWHELELSFRDPTGTTAVWSRRFLATTNPGVSRGALSRYLGGPERHGLAIAGGLGALAGFCLALFIMLVIRLARRNEHFFWPYLFGLALAGTVLGAIAGLLAFGIR
ncbi:MAG: VWA domain-containing protein [Candidatus Aminicenantales bacterium]